MIFKTYRYRLYPTEAQRVLFSKHFGCCRWVYNYALNKKIEAYKNDQASLSWYELKKDISPLKRLNETAWLSEVNSQSLVESIRHLDRAYKFFFKQKNGFPKFKHKAGRQSFCSPRHNKVDFKNHTLSVEKIKNIVTTFSRTFDGRIRTVTITQTATRKFYASILVEIQCEKPSKPIIDAGKAIGIDLGIKDFAVTSDGEKFDNPKYLRNDLKRLKVLQRRASRKKKGSANRKKANLRVAILHERVTNKRTDYLQKLSTKLVCENQATTFCMESLAVKNMIKNHNLSQAISDVSWGRFAEMMQYKCEWYGKNLIKINRFAASSKTCGNCSHINESLTLADRTWTCINCHVTHDRDVNAAINIRFMGLAGEALSGEPLESSTIVGAKKKEAN